jgi:predicted ATPase/DNA-binding SARP family transcriptional activator
MPEPTEHRGQESSFARAKTEELRVANPLGIRLLGPFQVLRGARPAKVSGGRRDALLAVLALARGRVVGVEELVRAVWGEELPAAPRNAVQHHIARLRVALGQESIVASADGYALPDASVDAVAFEDLLAEARDALREGDARAAADAIARGLALWRGAPLQGIGDTAWFSAEARRLESLRVDALEERFEAALALGEHREITSALRAALETNQFRERLWGQLMLALYRCGRQADALDTFQEARRVLAEQLGLEPGPELRRLQQAILAHDPAIAPIHLTAPRRGNLPSPTTSFVDREAELAELVALLREHRLVTLVGPPGVGKSRLALEAVRALEPELRDGGWLVEIARAGDAAGVVRVLAAAVDARGRDPLGRVIARLRDADATLIFDACEHALAEAARVASAVVAECPGVRVLATSREVLHVGGEVRVRSEPLPLPPPGSTDGANSPALRLFAARARAARPGFELTDETVPLAAEIARRVDGLPLALELAAARVNVLGLAELCSIVLRRLPPLDGRPSSDPIGTAQGLVQWSYDILHTDEKALLHQLAVHRGGASLSSLLAVAAKNGLDEATVTHLLGALVDKSIVLVSFPEEEARYDLLDTVRDYALDRLALSGGRDAARKAHAEYFATLAEAARPGVCGPDWLAWIRRLELDHDNLWAALAYARDAPDPGIAIRLGASLGWYFSLAERISEGRNFLELALAAASDDGPVAPRMELLTFLCFLATEELDLASAIQLGERALALAAIAPAPVETAVVRAFLSLAVAQSGDRERAATLAEEARQAAESTGDRWVAIVASVVGAMGALGTGDVPVVSDLAGRAIRHSQAIDYLPGLLPATLLQAWVAERRDDHHAATEAYGRVLELANRARFADHVAFALMRLGSNALASGDLLHAEQLERRALAAAEAARAPWIGAHARVQLGRALAATGDTDTAERLHRNALEWSVRPRPHLARESLFVVIADSPAAAALLGLAELADARDDAAAAADFRSRAKLAVA